MASLKKYLKEKGFVPVQMKRTSTDHFEVAAILNGQPGRFIVDTGASNTCVALEHADRFGLISEEAEVKAAGAGNAEMDAWISPENSLILGKWKKKKQPIVLFDLSQDPGETTDLAAEHPQRAAAMAARIQEIRAGE